MLRMELDPLPESPGKARAGLRHFLRRIEVDVSVVEDAELLVTEMVTNAVLHAKTTVVLEVHVTGEEVAVAVTDRSDRPLQARTPTPDTVTGRGLTILDELAPGWSVEYHEEGKTVRFSLAADRVLHNAT
jgi:anti-sigma regulatory factor (Ser/Thr protein kinase)